MLRWFLGSEEFWDFGSQFWAVLVQLFGYYLEVLAHELKTIHQNSDKECFRSCKDGIVLKYL